MTRRVSNPPNPWTSSHVEYLGPAPGIELQVYEEQAKSMLTENDSPDVPFRWSANPYRGCFHGCAYCYARPSHEYLDWGAGTDFERKIVVKTNAAEQLALDLQKRTWRRELLAFSGVTDCYQPLEASYGLTRRCLEVCHQLGNPVAIVTKGALVERDADVLAALGDRCGARVFMSIPFADDDLGRAIEPYAATPTRRLASLATLSEAGVSTGVAIAPVIPGLNDDQIPNILHQAREAGATHAFMILLRLPGIVAEVFEQRLRDALPLRADRVLSTLGKIRDEQQNASGFGERMRGAGPRWDAIQGLFDLHCRKLGFERRREADAAAPPRPTQGRLF